MSLLPLLAALFLGCGNDVDADGDGYLASVDCNDQDLSVNPVAAEVVYDGVDNDCNAATRDNDLDGDGFDLGEDCNDEDGETYPGATETCDGVDNDCNDVIDDGTGDLFYEDGDGDGVGFEPSATRFCAQPEGWTAETGDCDDEDPLRFPGNLELCNDQDDDCDGQVDEGEGEGSLFIDYDGDGFGSDAFTLSTCGEAPEGWVENSDDCDDADASANPNAAEVCDGVDNDCDEAVDEDTAAPGTWYLDYDGDGFGDDARSVTACGAPSALYVATGGDCDDTDAALTTDCTV